MEELLKQIGLTPSESKVYLALLEIGEAKASQILEKARLNSGRIYDVLNSLKNKGLISEIIKKKIKLFIPSPPERIIDYLDDKEKGIKNDKIAIQNMIPQLNSKYKMLKQKTNVEVFMGIEGMKTAYSILLKEAKNDKELCVYGIASKKRYQKDYIDLIKYYVYKQRKELKLDTKKIVSKEAKDEKIYQGDNSKIKYLPYTSMNGTEILGDIVMIQFSQDPIVMILIKNKSIAEDYKSMFRFLWKAAKS